VNGAFLLCLFTDGACDPSGSGEVLTLDGTTLALTGLSGNQLLATSASVPSPEPGTFGLMLIVVVGLMLMPRKRSAQGLQLDVGTHS
jgi:hypothetical protein